MMNHVEFINFLNDNLPKSSGLDRQLWAKKIINKNIKIIPLIDHFLRQDKNIANRFLWMLSDLGQLNSSKLLEVLPYLLSKRHTIKIENIEATFANYFLLVGVPLENETEVIDLMFEWLLSKYTNVTTKSRSIIVLNRLVEQHPELENEFKICLEDQVEKYSKDFDKKIRKILESMH